MMPAIYGNSYHIQQGPGFVTITYEMVHDTRIIPLDGRQHIASGIRQYVGDGRGHWEGNTLVVETTNFTDKTPYRGFERSVEAGRAFYAARAGYRGVGGHVRGSAHLGEAMDVCHELSKGGRASAATGRGSHNGHSVNLRQR